jgi:hypothetical protein
MDIVACEQGEGVLCLWMSWLMSRVRVRSAVSLALANTHY